MTALDLLRFDWRVVAAAPARSALLATAFALGVAAVVLLTSVGEGARRYVDAEFAVLGSRLLVIFPGRNETVGGHPPLYGETPRDLTLADAEALSALPGVARMAPLLPGSLLASRGGRGREALALGTTRAFFPIRGLRVARGRALPAAADREVLPVAVLGATLARELFGEQEAVGQRLRLGDWRVRVIGVLAPTGQSLGLELDEVAIVPVATAMGLFDTEGLLRVFLELEPGADPRRVEAAVRRVVRARHEGEDDVTVVSQDAVLAAFARILTTLNLAVAAIAAVSLVVAGVLAMNVSLIALRRRRAEIGLLKALGAPARTVGLLFLGEALLLALAGSGAGVLLARALVALGARLWPAFPLAVPGWAEPAALATALAAALAFSWWPAVRAARLDPVVALRGAD